jgi:hypothetical protein
MHYNRKSLATLRRLGTRFVTGITLVRTPIQEALNTA